MDIEKNLASRITTMVENALVEAKISVYEGYAVDIIGIKVEAFVRSEFEKLIEDAGEEFFKDSDLSRQEVDFVKQQLKARWLS